MKRNLYKPVAIAIAAISVWTFGASRNVAWAGETPAAAQADPAPAPAAGNAAKSGDRVVCRREAVLGSNIKKRVCHTVSEDNEIRNASQETYRELLQHQNGSPSG